MFSSWYDELASCHVITILTACQTANSSALTNDIASENRWHKMLINMASNKKTQENQLQSANKFSYGCVKQQISSPTTEYKEDVNITSIAHQDVTISIPGG